MKSIKSKLIIIFSSLLSVVIVLLSVVGYYQSKNSLNKVSNQLIEEKLHSDISTMSSYITYEFTEILMEKGMFLNGSRLDIEDNDDIVDKIYQDLGDVATIYKKDGDDFTIVSTNIRDKDGKRLVYGEALDRDQKAYKSLINDEAYTGITDINGEDYYSTYTLLVGRSGRTIGVLFIGVPLSEAEESIQSGLQGMRISFIVMSISLLLINSVITWIVGKHLTKGLTNVTKYSSKLQALDVSEDLDNELLNLKDEVGDVSRSVNVAIGALRKFAKGTDNISDEVRDYSELLLDNIRQVDSTSKEIVHVIDEIANGATNQAKDTEEGNYKVEELGKSIELNRKKLEEVIKYMSEAQVLRRDGHDTVKVLSEGSEKAKKAINEIYEVIAETNEKAKDIEKASSMIKNIAQQTNLLALNASIEAARAGESGKGFAVVANEVANLADESNKLTGEIEEVIRMLTDKTENAVRTVDSMVNMMNKQSISVDSTVDKFEGISITLEKTMDTVEELNKSSDDMNRKKEELIDVIQNLSAIAEENAASTEEVAASVEEQTATITELGLSIEKMSNLAETMKENSKKFKYE